MSVAELDIGDLTPRLQGRAAKPPQVAFVRELGEADIALLASERGTQPPTIARLRDRHHSLARALSSGMSDSEASAITGYDPSRISILKRDPTFQELVSHYQRVSEAAFADFHERAATLAVSAVNALQEAIDDDENPPSPSLALEIAKFAADRTGHAPVARSVSISAN